MGAYMCIARNGVPPAVSKTVQLNVNCKIHPAPKFENLHLMMIFICSPASDIGAYSAHRCQAAVGAKPLLRGGGLAQTNKLLDIRNRRNDCGK